MGKYKKSLIALLLAITLLISNTGTVEAKAIEEPKVDLEFFEEILQLIKSDYPFKIEEQQLLQGALKGMLQSIDPYSDYYTNEEAENLMNSINGNFSGIGVYIEERDGYINILRPIAGQPAEKAGIKKDDLIISVDGIDIKNMGLGKVSSMIKGIEGTDVTLEIKRGRELLTFKVKRQTIIINPVKYQIFEENIGHIMLEEFNSQATKEVKKVLKYFDTKGIKKIILDLRDNPGGLLNEAIDMAKLFVPEGPVVHIRENNKSLVTHVSTLKEEKYELIVLVNENSASASEILAGAIKDRKAGILIGTKTFGKGIVQSLIPTTEGSIIKLTTAEYLTPNKTSIHGKGIKPHITIKNTNIDKQLEKAINILRHGDGSTVSLQR